MSVPYSLPRYWDLLRPHLPARVAWRVLPDWPVTYQPNTGMEVGLCVAIADRLEAEGWRTKAEVQTSDGSVDIVAVQGPAVLVIEVKNINAGPAAVRQLTRYLTEIQTEYPHAVGILAAPSLTASVLALPSDIYFLPVVRA